MTGWNVLDLGKKTNAKVLAVLMVAILTVSAALVFVSNSEATTEYKEGGSITYHLGSEVYVVSAAGDVSDTRATNYSYNIKGDGTRESPVSSTETSVKLNTYFGIKSTEYNPEFWTGWGEVYLCGDSNYDEDGIGMWNFVGPKVNVTWNGVTTTVTKSATGSSIDISMPAGCTLVSVTSGGEKVDGNTLRMGSSAGSAEITINYSASVNKVFGGWTYHNQPDTMVYPGDNVAWTVTDLDAKWIVPDLYTKTSIAVTSIQNGAGELASVVTPYADWTVGNNDPRVGYTYNYTEKTVSEINGISTPSSGDTYTVKGNAGELTKGTRIYVVAGDVVRWDESKSKWVKDHDAMFSSIYHLDGTKTYSLGGSTVFPSGTYRTGDPYNLYTYGTRDGRIDYKAIVNTSSASYASGNVLIDNITFKTNSTNTHGGNMNGALSANGHRLILGTNISTERYEKSTDHASQIDKIGEAPNIMGGSVTRAIEKGKTAILNDGNDTTVTADLGSFVIIHSGVYNNVIAGGTGTTGSDGAPLSTYAVLKDCLVLDTIGAAGGGGTIKGNIDGRSGYEDGGAFTYLVGAFTAGDFWQDEESGYADFVTGCGPEGNVNGNTRQYALNMQSSVAQGGSTSGYLHGSSHLIIAGDSSVWDCMGAGRDGSSTTDFSYLEVTGRAEVRRVACGITTDGASGNRDRVVDGLRIHVSDDALVASIYGGGFDTWSYPSGISMSQGTIAIDITGGRIGDVYGGGYRGTIGDSSNVSALEIEISISGDTHIEGNVYGGGSGGLNKMKHAAATGKAKIGSVDKNVVKGQGYQSDKGVDGNKRSTGMSYVYGSISVEITGGTIDGDVYGGGMSVPKLLFYTNIIDFNPGPGGNSPFVAETVDNKPVETATVVGDVYVHVGGDARISGSVYGAGKGIKLDANGEVDETEYGFNKVVYRDGGDRTIGRQYWVDGGENLSNRTYDNSSSLNYANYAQVKGNVTVVIENKTWYHDQTAVIGSSYTVSASDADANKFIVLHRDSTLPTNYNIVLVDADGNATIAEVASGGTVGDAQHSLNGWRIKNRTITEGDTYTVQPEDADGSRTIVLFHPDFSTDKYTVLMIDDGAVKVATDESVNAQVPLDTSHIDGSVYGGGGFGKVFGSTMVDINSGIVGVNVFGGGLGVAGKTSIEGNRIVYIQGKASIGGSVYGGSEVGVDGPAISEEDLDSKDATVKNRVNQQLHANRSGIVIEGGYIEGSVFGGGLMGKTYGNTALYIGYYLPSLSVRTPIPVIYGDRTGIQISVDSVYAGGNISSTGEDDTSIIGAYKENLVMGSGSISIYGNENKSVNIPGSIMGSGNACKTRGETTIDIVNLFNANSMAGIHRATKVTIDRSNINILGRSTVTEIFNQVKNAAIFDIGELTLKGGTSISFRSPMDDIKALKSQTADGSYTTDKSPLNRLVYTDGSTVYIRYADENGNPVYGNVDGFTLMISTQGEYGAYAMGSTGGSGGFSINKDGSTTEADTSVSSNICCWYVSGISKKISTMYFQLDDDSRKLEWNETYITINKFQTDTSIMFTGGVFTKMSNDPNGDAYTFVRPGAESMDDEPSQLAMAIAYLPQSGQGIQLYDPTYRYMSIADGQPANQQGTFFKKDGMESDIDGINKNRSLVSVPMAYSNGAKAAAGPMNIYLCLTGKPIDSTAYVGYVTLIFQEIKQVNYEAVGPDGTIINTPRYLVANTTELRVDVYIYGSPTSDSSDTFSVEIKTDVTDEGYREGSASTLIPQTYSMAELNLARVDIVGAGSGSMPDIDLNPGLTWAVYKIPENGYIAPTGKTFSQWKITSGNAEHSAKPAQFLCVKDGGDNAYIIDGYGTDDTIDALALKNGLTYLVTEDGEITRGGEVPVHAGDVVRCNGTGWAIVAAADVPITGKEMAIEPVWKDILNVVFDSNGGSGTITSVPIGRDTEYVLPEADGIIAPTGQKFAYWLVTIGDGRAETRHSGDTITIEGDTVIKAMWSPSVTVSFNPGSHGTGTMGSVLTPSGQRYTLPMNAFTPSSSDYEFGSWAVVITDSGSNTTDSTKYPGETIRIPSNAVTMTVTAQWMDKPTMSTVTFALNGGTALIDKGKNAGDIVSNVDGWYVKNRLANQAYDVATAADTEHYSKDIKLNGSTVYHVDYFNNVYNAGGTRVSTVLYTDPECMDPYSVGTDIGAATVYTEGYVIGAGDKDANNFVVAYKLPNDTGKYTVIIVPINGSPTIDRNVSEDANLFLPNGTWVDIRGHEHGNNTYLVRHEDADTNRFIVLYEEGYDHTAITVLHVAMATDRVADGTKYRLQECPIAAPSGRMFAGWSVSVGGGSPAIYQPGAILTVTGGASVTALWSTQYVIGFANGGGDGTMPDQYMPYEGKYTIPDPVGFSKAGNKFVRWSSADGYYYPGQTITITGNMLLTAEWEPTEPQIFRVSFDPMDGSGYMPMLEKESGARYTLPDCEYTRSDRVFLMWIVTPSVGAPSNAYPGDTVTITCDTTLRAIWAAKFGSAPGVYTVIYIGADGNDTGFVRSQQAGANVTLPTETTYHSKSGGTYSKDEHNVNKYTVNGNDADSLGYIVLYKDNVDNNKYTVVTIVGFTVYVTRNAAVGAAVDLHTNEPLYCKKVLVPRDAQGKYRVNADDADSSSFRYIIQNTGNHIEFIFKAGDGTGSMPDNSILRSNSRYVLPESGFTAPAGKVFDKWEIKCNNVTTYGHPGQILYQSGVNGFVIDGYATVAQINALGLVDGAAYYVKDTGTITWGGGSLEVSAGTMVACNGTSWAVYGGFSILVTEIYLTAQWKTGSGEVSVDFSSGATLVGNVVITAEANQDNTTGWSNFGRPVVWDLSTGSLRSDSPYIGTLLGSLVGNVNFAVNGLMAVDSSGDVYLPSVDLVFSRGGVEAHTTLMFSDIREYSVTFIDHGLETVRYYPENTLLTRDMCETPTGNNFNGWYLDSTFVNRYDYNMVVNDESDGLKLYARYTYVVTLDCMNGVKYTLQVSEEDSGALLTKGDLPVPDYTGYTFDGWCKDYDRIYDWSYQSDRVYEDTTLYARWIGKEVRIYFWFDDPKTGELMLFDGTKSGVGPTGGKYNLQQAYMLNTERRLYPTVTWGDTFDVRNPYTGDSILSYAQSTIDFGASFVKWTVASPIDPTKHVGIYSDTVVGTKVLKYVTDEMRQGYDDLWEYYLDPNNDGGYHRKDWVGEGRPDTMEIHLKAETTKVAIKVEMGLSEEDQKYSPTVTIDDPESFLVYPNGPDLNNRGSYVGSFYDEFGNLYYAGTDGDPARYWRSGDASESPYEYVDGKLVRKDDHGATPRFYWNADGSIRYYYSNGEGCWSCLDENDIQSVTSKLAPGGSSIKHIAFPKNGSQQYRDIAGGDLYGNTLDSGSNLKSVAYAVRNGEETFLVEWNIENTSYLVVDAADSTNYRKDIKFNEGSTPVIFHITKDSRIVNESGVEIPIGLYTNQGRTTPYNLETGGNGTVYADSSYVRKYYEFVEYYDVVDGDATYVKYAQLNHETIYKIKADKTVWNTNNTKTNFKFYEDEGRTVVYDPSTSSAEKIYLVYASGGKEYLYFTNVTNNDTALSFYLKDEAGIHYHVTTASKSLFWMEPEHQTGNYHEFVFKLNNAVRNGYTLHGWHNEYISWHNAMTPSSDQVRKVHLWHDTNGYVTSAKLISSDNSGHYVETPLLVGDYVVDPKDADASGNIVVVPNDNEHQKPAKSKITKIIDLRQANDLITLDDGTWYVNGSVISDAGGEEPGTQYKVSAADADVEGNIIVIDSNDPVSGPYTVVTVDESGFRSVQGTFSANDHVTFESGSWKTKTDSTIDKDHDYIVNANDADVLGTIVIVPLSYTPSSLTVKVIKQECTSGSTVILNDISDSPSRGFDGWIVNDRDLDGDDYTLVDTDADKDRFVVVFKTENDDGKYTVIAIGDNGAIVASNLTAGVGKVDLDKGDWYCSTSASTHPVPKDANNRYVVNASDADGNRFIVLYKNANLAGEYTVIKVNGSVVKLVTEQPEGALIDGVKGWHVNNRTIDNSNYTVRSDDADVSGSIVLATKWKDMTEYTVKWISDGVTKRSDTDQMVGIGISAPFVEKEGQILVGWKAATGIIDDVYVVAHKDKSLEEEGVGVIELHAIWSDDTYENYRIVKASDKGGYTVQKTGYISSGSVSLIDSLSSDGYTKIGWKVITGSNPRLITASKYVLDPDDADSQHDIILVAEWAKTYSVMVTGQDPVLEQVSGMTVPLEYPSSAHSSQWKVRDDVISQGDRINDPEHTFTMNYDALWDQIPYSVHLSQPANGIIEVYLEDRDGSSTSRLLTDEEVNSMVFYHGDKLRISYTPNNSKVAFIKWIVTNTSYLESATSASTILVIQDDCSIAVDESTGRLVDIIISFDDKNLDPDDRQYTRVFLRDPSTGDYYEGTYIPGMVKMDHYVMKVPYGNGYETVVWYGWSQPAADGSCQKLPTFEDAPDEYVLVGTVDVNISNTDAVVYDIISAGFIDTINKPNVIEDFADTEYGLIEREYETDPKFDFLFTCDEYTVVDASSPYVKNLTKNNVVVYHIASDNKVYNTSDSPVDIKFYTRSDCLKTSAYNVNSPPIGFDNTVYTPIIKGSNGGNIVVYQTPSAVETYTVVKVGTDSISVQGNQAKNTEITGVDGWHLKGRTINGSYTVKANDADDGGYIVIYQAATALGAFNVVKIESDFDVDIERSKEPNFKVDGVDGWHVRDTTISGSYYVNSNDAYPGASETSLENIYSFAPTSGAGHPIRIVDGQGNVVVKVTKYVGIQRSILARLAANNLNIDNPNGGTPPVVVTFDPNLTYTTYEGFPWKDVNNRNVFALESDINLGVGLDSNKNPQKTFYLNWVRTDSPADIIIQMESTKVPDHYAVADVRLVNESGGHDKIFEGVRYDLRSEESDPDAAGFIVLYESPNAQDTYTVIKQTALDTVSSVRGLSIGSELEVGSGWMLGKTGEAATITDGKYTVSASDADENRFIVLYKVANGDGKYSAIKVGDGGTAVESNLSTGATVTGVDGWHVVDRTIHGNYTVDVNPYYHVDAPLDHIAGYEPVAEVYNGGNIVVYQTANPTAPATYTVVIVGNSDPTPGVTVERGKAAGSTVSGVNGWFVKGRTIDTSYTVDAADADEGGFIVVYQTKTDDGEFNVIKVGNSSVSIERDKSAGATVEVTSGWHVKGRTTGPQYTVDAGDAYTSGMGAGGECRIHDSDELHLKVPTSYGNNIRIMINYEKGSGWYALNDSTFGYYGNITYDVPVTGNVAWGTSLELPTSFTAGGTPVQIGVWVAGLPNGENVNILKNDSNRFFYTVTKADAISTSDFIYTVQNTGVTGYEKEVLQGGEVEYYIDSRNLVYDAETRDPVSVKFFTSWVCTVETAYDISMADGTIYTPTRIIFTPLLDATFITLTFSTYYGEFDFNNSQRVSVSVPAGGTMLEYARTMAEIGSVSRFITTYSTGSWEYNYGGFYWGESPLDLSDNVTKITTDRTYLARWTPNESNKRMFSYTSDGNASISALRDAVTAEAIGEGETKKFVVDTEINMAIQPKSGYVIDLDRTRGELGYTLVGTEIYLDITTAAAPTGSSHTFSSWRLWDAGSPVRASHKVTEMTDSAKNGFLVYMANWSDSAPHAGSIALVFVSDESMTANAIYANGGDTKTIPAGSWRIWNEGAVITDSDLVAEGMQYTVDASKAVDGYILFVKDRMVLSEYNAVFATEYGTVSRAADLEHYYKDANGSRYYNVTVDKVYRYETDHWTEYRVASLAGHDGSFIVQFSTNAVSYKATREGQFYTATPMTYTATLNGSGVITGFTLDAEPHTAYTVTDGVIKDAQGNVVSMKLFTDLKLMDRIVDLTAPQTLVSSKVYSGVFVECDPVQGFYAAKLEGTSVQGWMAGSDTLGVTGATWYVGSNVVTSSTTIADVIADAPADAKDRFIVAQRGYANPDGKYTVVLVDGSSVTLYRNLSSGATVTGVDGWKVNGTLLDTDTYTVAAGDADSGRFIVIHRYDNPAGKYTVVKLDDNLTYYATKAEAKAGSGTQTPSAALSYAKPRDVVETYIYTGSVHYLLKPYGSEYECIETSILQYEIAPYGSQYKDTFGTVWAKNNDGTLRVVSATVWVLDPLTSTETSMTITNLAELPAQYYLRDSYGNYYKGNYFDNNSLTISSLDLAIGNVITPYYVRYISDNEYVKALYSDLEESPAYLMKRNGSLVVYDDKTAVNGTLYFHGTDVVYNGDYSIVSVVAKYNTDTEVRINNTTYHRDGFGNLYYDWLGAPTELPGNRGFSWVFLLKDSIQIDVYMKEVSYNINFVVNGNKVKATDMNAISTVTTMDIGISDSRNVAVDAKVDLDSGTWYSYKSGSAVSKDGSNRYTVAAGDALSGFILLYKTANTPGTYTVVKVDSGATTMYRGLKAGDTVNLDADTWKCNGSTAAKTDNKYTVDLDDAHNGFIVLYKADPSGYTVLKVDDAKDYYGSSIRQYTVVAFDGPQSNRGMTWYTDPDYDHEYSMYGADHILTPDKFQTDIVTPTALITNEHTFSNWSLFGSSDPAATYSSAQSVVLTGGSQHLGDDRKNYFYIIEATWTNPGSGEYKIVYASSYGGMTGSNLVYADDTEITLKNIDDDEFKGWRVWNREGNDYYHAGGTKYTPNESDAETINDNKYILMVADWGEDLTYASNVVYATEFGEAPNMESIRKYQFNATRDITLYGHTGTYVLFLHDFDDTYEPMKFELVADENYRITIPKDHYGYGDYVFVGWSAHKENGKRAYTYAPEESINISALDERINLYPYYLSDGSEIKYYDGQASTLKLGMDDVLRAKQSEPDTSVLAVSYSDSPIEHVDPEHPGSPKSAIHAGDYYVYYAAEIKTPLGTSSITTYGNTETAYEFNGKASLKILKVDAYAIAPSAYMREGDGAIIAASSPRSLDPGDMSGGNIVVTSEDVVLIGLVVSDVESKKLYTGDSDKGSGMIRTVVDVPGDSMTIRPLVTFSIAQEYVDRDYNLKYIDGSLTIYPIDASKYEGDGYV